MELFFTQFGTRRLDGLVYAFALLPVDFHLEIAKSRGDPRHVACLIHAVINDQARFFVSLCFAFLSYLFLCG